MKNAIWFMAVVILAGAGCGKKSVSAQDAGRPAKEPAAGRLAKADARHAGEEHGAYSKEHNGDEHDGEGQAIVQPFKVDAITDALQGIAGVGASPRSTCAGSGTSGGRSAWT